MGQLGSGSPSRPLAHKVAFFMAGRNCAGAAGRGICAARLFWAAMLESEAGTRFDGVVPGVPGASIRQVETLPAQLAGGTLIGPYTEAAPGALLFEVPGIARYLIRDGQSIEVEVAADADPAAVELFLHSSARATLIHQRGELPLNAATLLTPGFRCVAICGPSTFGKSTLAAELCRRGWALVADDITRVSWNGTMAVAWPSSNRLKLWRDACERNGLDVLSLQRVRRGIEKYYVPVSAAKAPAALAIVVRFRVKEEVDIVHLPPDAGASVLSEGSFRPRYISPLGRREEHERMIRLVSRSCRAVTLDGARKCTIEALADRLEKEAR